MNPTQKADNPELESLQKYWANNANKHSKYNNKIVLMEMYRHATCLFFQKNIVDPSLTLHLPHWSNN